MTNIPYLFNQTNRANVPASDRAAERPVRGTGVPASAPHWPDPRISPNLPRRRKRPPPKPMRSWIRNSLGCGGLKARHLVGCTSRKRRKRNKVAV
jgi:hypothetical protein